MSSHDASRAGARAGPAGMRKVAIAEATVDAATTGTRYTGLATRHCTTPEFWEAARKGLGDDSARLEQMDASGIEVEVLSLNLPGIETVRIRKAALGATRRINDLLADRARESGGRLEALAAIPFQDTDIAITEMQRAVTALGMRGVLARGYTCVYDDERAHHLEEDRFDAFWEALAELGVPLYLCTEADTCGTPRPDRRDDSTLVGPPWSPGSATTAHALRLIDSGVFDRHPTAHLVLGGLGETVPRFARLFDPPVEYHPRGARPARRLQDYLADNLYVTTSGGFDTRALITAILTIGADRILLAVGYSHDVGVDAAWRLDDTPIAEADRRKIAGDNAIRLLGLPDDR